MLPGKLAQGGRGDMHTHPLLLPFSSLIFLFTTELPLDLGPSPLGGVFFFLGRYEQTSIYPWKEINATPKKRFYPSPL